MFRKLALLSLFIIQPVLPQITPIMMGASANITVSTVSVAADGLTFTATASASIPALVDLGPCFVVTGGNANTNILSGSSNGTTTLTFLGTPAAPWYATDTLKLQVTTAPTCLMVDGSGNTPMGQTNVSVTNGSTWHAAHDADMITACRYNAGPAFVSNSGYPNVVRWNSPGSSIDCNATGVTAVNIIAFGYGLYTLLQNGTRVSCPSGCASQNPTDYGDGVTNFVAATTNATNYYSVPLGAGLSSVGPWQISVGDCVSYQGCLIAAVQFVGGTLGTAPAGTLPIVWIIGDSESGSGGSGPVDNTQYDIPLLGFQTAIGLTEQVIAAAGNSCAQIAPLIAHLGVPSGATPAIGINACGSEDVYNGTSIPTFTATYEGMLCDELGISACGLGYPDPNPPTQLYARGIVDLQGGAGNAYNVAIQAAVAAVNAAHGTSIKYYDGSAFISQAAGTCPTHDLYTDTYHLCGALDITGTGFGKEANGEIPVLWPQLNGGASYGWTATTTSGDQYHLLSGFSVGELNGSTFGVVNLSDGGKSGDWSCASGSYSGVGTVTGVPVGTSCTYRPTASGSITLTPTNSEYSWTDASPITLTITAAPLIPAAGRFMIGQ